MKITFDSNVWRIVASPEAFPGDQSIDSFKAIRKAIAENQITPFLCETVFTLEGIEKENRIEFFTKYRPMFDITEEIEGDSIKLSFSMGPDESAHPGNTYYPDKHLKDAIAIGFQILKLPRIGMVVNQDIETHYYRHEDLSTYHEKVFAVARDIESNEAGMFHVKEIGNRYHSQWTTGIKQAPDGEALNIIKAIAEWADGDSVACHIAVGGDYFCTRDTAKKAGRRSILHESNLEWLRTQHGFQVITPEEIASILQQ